MELSQIDTDRRHHVSRSMDQRFWDQYQSEDSVSRKHIPSRLLVTSSAEEHFLALSGRRRRRVAARCRSFRSIREKKFCYYGAKASPQCKSLCKAISCVRPPPPQWTIEKGPPICWRREQVSWIRQQCSSVPFTDESRL